MSQLPASMSLVKAISLIVAIEQTVAERKADADAVDEAAPDLLSAERARSVYLQMQTSLDKIQTEKKIASPSPSKSSLPW